MTVKNRARRYARLLRRALGMDFTESQYIGRKIAQEYVVSNSIDAILIAYYHICLSLGIAYDRYISVTFTGYTTDADDDTYSNVVIFSKLKGFGVQTID